MNNPLLDKDFLLKLDNDRHRTLHVKLISLDFNENPIEEMLGRITNGSINVDGSSNVRRTCSLTIAANELNIHQYYWGFKTKFKCFIGIQNNVDDRYEDIIFFPMGTFIITSFNTNQQLSQYTVQISGKDKMCLLNGELGGTVTALSVDFGQLTEQQRDGSLKKTKLLIKDIVRESVHEYGHEPYQNIIVNDLDESALELMEYQGDTPLYLSVDNEINEITNQTLNENTKYWININGQTSQISVSQLDDITYFLDHRIDLDFEYKQSPTKLYTTQVEAIQQTSHYYTVIKAEYGAVVGYRIGQLVYNGDLISNVGESVTSMLDKIKSMLGDYEYFYNLDGQFVWQRTPTYVNVSWNNLVQNDGDEKHGESASYTSSLTYSFENHNLISSFQNTPALSNIKNDFSIFGTKKNNKTPVHLRYAIDKKPTFYKSYDGILYTTEPLTEEEIIKNALTLAEAELLKKITNYQKQPLPEGLNDDWWDVWDWGEYYKLLTGVYPPGDMSMYKTETTRIDLEKYFPIAESYPPSYPLGRYSVEWKPNWECFIFDTIDGYLGYTGHNPYCTHGYDDYFMEQYRINRAAGHEFHAYFYKPKIPSIILEQTELEVIEEKVKNSNKIVDWREIIYQMARDYLKHGMTDEYNYEPVKKVTQEEFNIEDYYIKKITYTRASEYMANRVYYTRDNYGNYNRVNNNLSQANFSDTTYYYQEIHNQFIKATNYSPNTTYYTYVDFLERLRTYNIDYYPTGITGYEQYYTDMISFWRENYDPDYSGSYEIATINRKIYYKEGSKYCWFKNQEGLPYQQNVVYYTKDLYNNWQAHKDLTENDFNNYSYDYYLPVWGNDNVINESSLGKDYIYQTSRIYYTFRNDEYYSTGDNEHPAYWSKTIWNEPEELNFWIDFLDTEGDLAKYSIPRIGDRPKAENNKEIKALYYRETPNVIFVNSKEDLANLKITHPGYTFISLQNNIDHLFKMSSQRQSCKDRLNTLLYQFAVCPENITLQAIPVYYLQPNTRIYITDEKSGINGEYIISKIGYSLSNSGQMTINATKAVDRIY